MCDIKYGPSRTPVPTYLCRVFALQRAIRECYTVAIFARVLKSKLSDTSSLDYPPLRIFYEFLAQSNPKQKRQIFLPFFRFCISYLGSVEASLFMDNGAISHLHHRRIGTPPKKQRTQKAAGASPRPTGFASLPLPYPHFSFCILHFAFSILHLCHRHSSFAFFILHFPSFKVHFIDK